MERHIPSVLFICTANICRSPMAEGLFRALIREEFNDQMPWRIESAGTWTRNGLSAAPYSIQAMAERGIDISNHQTRTIEEINLEEFDLILTMESGHKEAIQVEFPEARDRVFMLSELIKQKTPIFDPVGLPIEVFRKTADHIDQILCDGFPVILQKINFK